VRIVVVGEGRGPLGSRPFAFCARNEDERSVRGVRGVAQCLRVTAMR